MRDSYRPLLRLALFGTYTIIAVGLSELRAALRRARSPEPTNPPWTRRRRSATRSPSRRRLEDPVSLA
jgi:hypothetical protein